MKTTFDMDFHRFFWLGMKRGVPELMDLPAGIHLNLGAGYHDIPGAIGLDLPMWNADVDPIPYEDGAVSAIHAYHFLEHVKEPLKVLKEMERVLVPGGVVNVVVPYYTSQMAHHDLTHRTYWTEETWRNHFRNTYFHRGEWKLEERFNVIAGIKERNLALFTQLVRLP